MKTVIYYNVTTGEIFDQDGTLRTINNPFYAVYGEHRIIEWHLMASTNAETNVSTWIPWTDWEITPSLAFTAADDNYIAAFPGKLKLAAEGGSSAVIVVPDSMSGESIAPSGRLRFFRNDSSTLILEYSACQSGSEGYVFAVEVPEGESFGEHARVDILQPPLISSEQLVPELSDPQNGVFAFDLSISGWRLSQIMEYSNTETMNVKGMELSVAGVDPDTMEERILLRCQAPLSIKGVLCLFRSPAASVPANLSSVQEWVLALFSSGTLVEFQDAEGNWSVNSENASAFRWKLAGVSSMPWSPEIPLS